MISQGSNLLINQMNERDEQAISILLRLGIELTLEISTARSWRKMNRIWSTLYTLNVPPYTCMLMTRSLAYSQPSCSISWHVLYGLLTSHSCTLWWIIIPGIRNLTMDCALQAFKPWKHIFHPKSSNTVQPKQKEGSHLKWDNHCSRIVVDVPSGVILQESNIAGTSQCM